MRTFSHVFDGRMRDACVVSAAVGMALLLLAATASGQTLSTIYSFTGTPDGANPFQTNLVDVNNTFYGDTSNGGEYGFGTIFKITSAGKEKILYNFTGGTDGANPNAGLVRDKGGNFYGTAVAGGDLSCVQTGTSGCGVVFELSAAGKYSVLYAFTGSSDGANPQGVVMDSAGNLYGPTFYGGDTTCFVPYGCGVVFKLTKASNWSESALHTFEFDTNGTVPQGFLNISGTTLYGATTSGGNLADCGGSGCGVIFKMPTSTGAETVLYTFTGGADGSGPTGGMILDSNGNLYGTTAGGGDLGCTISQYFSGCGVVFRISPAGKEKILHTFTGTTTDGAEPFLGVVRDKSGNLYGTTGYGGTDNVGTVYEIPATGGYSPLYNFTGATDGGVPTASPTLDSSGNLWSTTYYGGDLSCNPPTGCGTLFKLVP
jgi:uncharacterized repeat protein (TIGR03803 family)